MARWRTLHEIAVIARFIGKYGEDLAERYILHQQVDSRRAMQDYIACHERLGYESLKAREVEAVERSYQNLLVRFGLQTSTRLGLLHPTFDNIVALRIMILLERKIGEAFGDAHQQLFHDSA